MHHWSHRIGVSAALLAAMAAFAIEPLPAQTTAVVPPGSSVIIAPTAPPPAQVETIPPPPATAMTWQPGHWVYSGGNWDWVPGQYMAPPQGVSVWVPGQWVQQPDGRYVWNPGHWS
jgi:hypothetical protein